ncbi:MAG TPA: plastocyanin/azurin family copper-binding protein [Bryobacteraceae bacterium]
MAGVAITTAQAEEWQARAGAETPDRGSQALAFLPNEFWIHAGDSIHWMFPTHERHTITFLTPGEVRPAPFGSTFGVPIACPGAGVTPDGSSFTGLSCVSSGVLLLPEDSGQDAIPPSYSVVFPVPGNFKFVCLVHADMTGVVHVRSLSDPLPHDQTFYDRQALAGQVQLLSDASRLQGSGTPADGTNGNDVAAGVGEVLTTTGAGSQTASLMRFLRNTLVVRVGDTVEWTNLDPSINHTVSFGVEPLDPRPPSGNVMPTSDGARQAVISSPTDNVNSGFLSPAPQDRANLAQSPPGITRFRVTFTSPGTFNYICAVHDQLGMKGTVIVHP